MDWPDELSEALPPRGDEPAQLRSDIVDELLDHLISAVDRERRRGGDEQAARRAALARFGNPAAVARRLWFDNIKGYVMTQRIVLALASVMAVALLGAMTLAYSAFRENRAVNEALLARLEALAERPQVEPISQWSKLTVRVTKEIEDGQPVVGFPVSVRGKAIHATESATLSENTNESGEVTFEPILAGAYWVRIAAPWGDHFQDPNVTLLPGSDQVFHVIAPGKHPGTAKISFQVDWPDDLRDKGLLVGCYFAYDHRNLKFGQSQWFKGVRLDGTTENTAVEINADEQRLVKKSARSQTGMTLASPSDPVEQIREWRSGLWRMFLLRVYALNPDKDSATDEYLAIAEFRLEGLDDEPRFSADADRQNDWTIKLPEPLLEQVRTHLRAEAEKPESLDSPGVDSGST